MMPTLSLLATPAIVITTDSNTTREKIGIIKTLDLQWCCIHIDAKITKGLFHVHHRFIFKYIYRQVSNVRRTLVGNEIVDHSDVVGASPVGAAPTTSSFST